jgi:predicted RNA-binding Zn ribbon-like protein
VTILAHLIVTCQDGDVKYSFGFVGGAPSLDFVGTLILRRSENSIELLASPEDLDDWFRQSGLVGRKLGSDAKDLASALELREAIFSIIDSKLDGQKFDRESLRIVNAAATIPPLVVQLAPSGQHTDGTPAAALSSLARDVIELLSGPEAELVKECSYPSCNQVYVDRSRGARREWHAMDPCGNKIKAAAYRARKREEANA